jgi:NarL family two-component system sensor histidine kinase LiaS
MTQLIDRVKKPFRRLRWQLTLSYAAVTVGTLLVVALILASFILAPIFVPDDVLTPEDWLEILNEELVPYTRSILTYTPPNTEALALMLGGVVEDTAITSREVLSYGDTQLLAITTAAVDLLVVGADGTMLGTSGNDFLPGAAIGQPFDANLLPGLSEPLRAALAGEEDPAQFLFVDKPNERFIFAAPVSSANGGEKRVLGAVVVNFRTFPSEQRRAAHYVGVVTRSTLIFLLGATLLGALFGSITTNRLVKRFKRVSAAADAWSQGDFSEFIHDPAGDEISHLTRTLNHMAKQLQALLARRQEMAVAEERNRLARDLHDSAKQQAFAASARLGAAAALFDEDPGAAKLHLREGEKLVDKVRKELTDLILELRPMDLEAGGIAEALHKYAVDWAHHSEIEIEMQVHGQQRLPLEIEQTLFRIAQEALANVARHSQAHHAEIVLVFNDDAITLTIVDDGSGFDAGQPQAGMGLRSMQERAASIGGDLVIKSEPGEGTVVSVRCELSRLTSGD